MWKHWKHSHSSIYFSRISIHLKKEEDLFSQIWENFTLFLLYFPWLIIFYIFLFKQFFTIFGNDKDHHLTNFVLYYVHLKTAWNEMKLDDSLCFYKTLSYFLIIMLTKLNSRDMALIRPTIYLSHVRQMWYLTSIQINRLQGKKSIIFR